MASSESAAEGSLGDAPDAVRRVAAFLARRDVWFALSRNLPARSCRDAARKRSRLGHTGIPLRDEMKSFFGKVISDGQEQLLIAHCRADRRLDLDAVSRAAGLAGIPIRLNDAELRSFGASYGMVNPFETWEPNEIDGRALHSGVLQVFDRDLLLPLGVPGTVMTNAGDLRWAVEFRAADLFEKMDHAVAGDIAMPDLAAPPRPPHLRGRRGVAVITGNSPESGIALWSRLNAHVRLLLGEANAGDASMPPVRVASLPELGMTMELDRRAEQVWAALAPVIDELCTTDIALLAIACNTTQFFVDRIRARCEPHGVTFVCLPEVVAKWLIHEGVHDVAVVGIPWVTEFHRGWSAYEEPFKCFNVEQLSERAPRRLMDLAYQVKEDGPTEGGLNKLRAVLNQEVQSGHVVLALTELSVLLATQRRTGRSGKVIIDPVDLYGEALARQWLGLSFPARSGLWEVTVSGCTDRGQLGHDHLPHHDPAGNEDALVLGSVVVQQDGAHDADQPTVGYRHARLGLREDSLRLCVAVVDGLGSHAAGAEASRLVANRVRDAATACMDDDDCVAMLGAIDAELSSFGPGDRGAGASPRGAAIGGLIVADGEDPDGSLSVVGFVAGDCLIMRLSLSKDDPSLAWASERLRPQVGANGGLLACIGGGRRGTFEVEALPRVAEDAVFVLCTDGLVRNLNLNIADDLPLRLATHPLLKPLWLEVASSRTREADRRLLERFFEVIRRPAVESRPDDASIAILRLLRGQRQGPVITEREALPSET